MSFELAPGTLLNNRYQIKKVVRFDSDGGVYVARDLKGTDKNWIVKELIPHRDLDEETLTRRRVRFIEAVESAMQFEHPTLPRILEVFTESRREYVVMEYVEGVTLQVLCDMSVNPLPEAQIIPWAFQICDALSYLHNRPHPFLFGALDPTHVILTPEEKIKLVNFGLDRFFGPDEPPPIFAENPEDVRKEFADLGKTLCLLLTKKPPTPLGIVRDTGVSTQTANVVNIALEGEKQTVYQSVEDIHKALELALHPPQETAPATEESKTQAATTRIMPGLNVVEPGLLTRAILAFASQRVSVALAEIVALIALGVGLYAWTHPGITYKKSGPTAYLAVGGRAFAAIRVTDPKVVDHQSVLASIGDMVASGSWLYISDASTNRILRYQTETDTPPEKHPAIMVDRNPTRMVVDESGRYMFVVHESTRNVSRVNLRRDPPQMDAILAVGNVPQDLAVSPKADLLFVANAKDRTVSILEPDTSKLIGDVSVPGTPFGMTVVPDGTGPDQLWVCLQDPDGVAVIDIADRAVKQTITDLDGCRTPTCALASGDGKKVWVAMAGSSNVLVLDTDKKTASKTIPTAASPQRLLLTPSRNQLWVICADGATSVTMIDPTSDSVLGQVPLGKASGAAAIAP